MRHKLNMQTVHHPLYWKQVKDRLEAANTKVASATFRRKLLEDQKRMNYSSEYDRIRGILQHSSLPGRTLETLKKRKDELKSLGAKAFRID